MPKKQQEIGAWGERIAAEYLLVNGYTIRERNYRPNKRHEIDLIAQKGETMVFVEVKVRNENSEDPVLAVDDKKIRHIVLASDTYLHNQDRFYDPRYDIIAITGNEHKYKLEHYPGAFIPPLFSGKALSSQVRSGTASMSITPTKALRSTKTK